MTAWKNLRKLAEAWSFVCSAITIAEIKHRERMRDLGLYGDRPGIFMVKL